MIGRISSSDSTVDRVLQGVYQGLSFDYYATAPTWEHKGAATSFSADEYCLTMANAWRSQR